MVVNGRIFDDTAAGIHLPPQARRLGYVFQGYALFPHLTVAENVAFGLRDRPAAERRHRTTQVLAQLGLEELAGRDPRELSGASSSAWPSGGPLRPTRRCCSSTSRSPRSTRPTATARRRAAQSDRWGCAARSSVVTHDLAEAYQLGDRLVIYEGGRVVQAGPKADVLGRPGSEGVARLIGLRNVVRGTVVKAGPDRIEIAWRGHTVEAVNSPTAPFVAAPGTAVAFMARPEHVRLIRKDRAVLDPTHHTNLLRGTVIESIDHGTSWTLLFRIAAPGPPSQGPYDLEIEVPHLVYEILDIARDREWEVSMHRGALQVLAGV